MTLPSVTDANYPTHEEIRSGLLRAVRYAFARRGLEANVLEGSERWYRYDAFARRVSIAIANNQISATATSPLEAQGQDLLDLAAVFGITPRPASFASGFLTIRATGTISIPKDYQSTARGGRKHKTTVQRIAIANGARVEVIATTAGRAGNVEAGEEVTWDSAAVGGLDHRATVAAGGITGGEDEDDVERVRARLLDRIAFPAVGNNWAQTKADAEAASAAVLVAFVYPAVRGPSSEDVALVGSDGDGTLSSSTVARVTTGIQARQGGNPSLNVTGIDNQELDVVLAASLPLPQSAGGAGGGWLDAAPWPSANVKVTAYNSTTGVATATGGTSPSVGTRIAIWDPDGETLYEYTILTVAGAGPWTITVVGGFSVDPTGAYISAGAESLQSYFATALTEFRKLGPGEKTDSPDILPRGRRHPSPDVAYPSDLTNTSISAILRAHPELLELSYSVRYETGTTTTRSSPSLPATTADPPNRLRVRHLAIRKA
jgi:uncharacterized phage protein gp47/JayE